MPDVPAAKRLSTFNSLSTTSSAGASGSGSTLLGKNNKVDPYYLITRVCHYSRFIIQVTDYRARV